jgi:beta-hydroxyacyl-ACP dehydratase FabZ
MAGFGLDQIQKILPHRYPFLFIDRVLQVSDGPEKGSRVGRIAKALKNITVNEEVFNGHFPGRPIMPGVLLVEAMAQAGGIACSLKEDGPMQMLIARISNARFRRPVVPGDSVFLEAKVAKAKGPMVVIEARCLVGDEVVAECEYTAYITPVGSETQES